MKKISIWLVTFVVLSSPAHSNDWEKFYRPLPFPSPVEPSATAPELIGSVGSAIQDANAMWRKGFVVLGYSSFNSPNEKTSDAMRWATKLKARYVILNTNLESSSTTTIPLTLPQTTTSTTSGNVAVTGSGGYANGTYSGTTTNYGTQTTYIPVTVNRFQKTALYFAAAPQKGAGVLTRELTPQEISTYDTQRGFVIRAIRDGSPAYQANLLPGDAVIQVNDQPADLTAWHSAIASTTPAKIHLIRNGQARDITLTIPPEWRVAP
jgi:hypothetical protein